MTSERGERPGDQASEFDADTAVEPLGGGRYGATITSGWDIGTNPNGGYLLATVLRAVGCEVPKPDPLTVTAHYLRRPDKGPGEVEVEVLRSGRNFATASARLVQGGSERIRVLATYGDLEAATGPTHVRDDRPSIPPPESCLGPEARADALGSAPEVFRRSLARLDPRTGWITGERTGVARTDGWTRFADGREPDALSLAFFADGMPPAVFELSPAAWVPTLELTVQVRARPAPGWLQGSFETRYLVDGHLEEDGRLWDSTGRLVAMSRQLALLIPAEG